MVIEVILAALFLYSAALTAVLVRQSRSKPAQQTQQPTQQKRADISAAARRGNVAEQLLPILPGCPYNVEEMFFIGGRPVDYIIYVGLSEAKAGTGDIKEIILADVKTGSARLSPHQRAIKRAVEEGRVRWETIRVDRDFTIK